MFLETLNKDIRAMLPCFPVNFLTKTFFQLLVCFVDDGALQNKESTLNERMLLEQILSCKS